jgi:hypothetical protein
MKFAALIATVVVVLTAAAAATAGTSSLRVIGSSSSSGDFATTAPTAHARGVHALYLRGTGRHLENGMAWVACTRGSSLGSKQTTIGRMVSGRLYRLRMAFPGDCQVTASVTGSGPIKLQILAR